jgi:hypothetical protein
LPSSTQTICRSHPIGSGCAIPTAANPAGSQVAPQMPPGIAASLRSCPPDAVTDQACAISHSNGSTRVSARKPIRDPSGDQMAACTWKAERVTRVGFAPGRARTTHAHAN